MRILTVRQPWAYAIIHRGKDVENRARNIAGSYRGPVAIHAAAAWDWDVTYPVGPTPHPTSMSLVRGAIIGVVDLIEVHLCNGHCSPWAQEPVDLGGGLRDIWHLELANPRDLYKTIPFKGALGLRRLDEATIARIEAQL